VQEIKYADECKCGKGLWDIDQPKNVEEKVSEEPVPL